MQTSISVTLQFAILGWDTGLQKHYLIRLKLAEKYYFQIT